MENIVPRRSLNAMIHTSASGEKFILDVRHRWAYRVNEVGLRLWELMDQALSFEQITQTITSEFDVDSETAEKQMKEFFEELCSLHLAEA
jgi:hypothetical protein